MTGPGLARSGWSGQDVARLGSTRPGLAVLVEASQGEGSSSAGSIVRHTARRGSPWLGVARQGEGNTTSAGSVRSWLGRSRQDWPWHGTAWLGDAGRGAARVPTPQASPLAHGVASPGTARQGRAGLGQPRHGFFHLTPAGSCSLIDVARPGGPRPGEARHGLAGHGAARQGHHHSHTYKGDHR